QGRGALGNIDRAARRLPPWSPIGPDRRCGLVAMAVFIAFAALLIERLFGYPDAVYRAVGHPVTWIGMLISWLDRRWTRDGDDAERRRSAGVPALLTIVPLPVAVATIVSGMLSGSIVGIAILALLASSLLAQRSLEDHVAAVAAALETD